MLQLMCTLQVLGLRAVESVQRRVERSDRGQTAAEYLGIVVVVAAIIAALAAAGFGAKIVGGINKMIDKIIGG